MDKSLYSQKYTFFLELLRHSRIQAGLTQVDLAERLDETQTFISKCERGERRLDFAELDVWCGALGIKTSEFVQYFEDNFQSGLSVGDL